MLEYEGLVVDTPENLYEPREDSFLAGKVIERVIKEKKHEVDVLDLGTGTGLLGLLAAKNGNVKRVVFSDVNSEAVSAAKSNFQANKKLMHAEAEFARSDLFENIRGKFDIIIFNAPYLPAEKGEKVDKRSMAWQGGEKGIELSLRFVESLKDYLKKEGEAILVASSLSDYERLASFIKEKGLVFSEAAKAHFFFEEITVLRISKRAR